MIVMVHVHLRQSSTGLRDAPEPAHCHVQVDADTCESGRDRISGEVLEG